MTQSISVLIRSSEGTETPGVLYYSSRPPWQIRLEHRIVQSSVFEGDDLFSCLCSLRQALEVNGCRILCNGARVDAYPSPMLRQMGGGLVVYLLRKGHQAGPNELVDLFGHADADTIGTVEQQREFRNEWLDSLKAGLRPTDAAREEAKRNPGGWVYQIDGHYTPNEQVPSWAIVGAWKVGDDGVITGEFQPNPNFRGKPPS